MTGYTLNKPHPDHVPTVGRMCRGFTQRTAMYATTLVCSCGWRPGGPPRWGAAVSDKAPSKGGKTAASHAYLRHLQAELVVAEVGKL